MTFERFVALAKEASLVPVWRDLLLDTDTAVSAFAKVRRPPFAFLLESAPAGSETWSRYTFLGTEPREAWRYTDGVAERWLPDVGWHGAHVTSDPIGDLQTRIRRDRPARVPELGAFWSGAVGYFSYDIARTIEHLPAAPPRAIPAPDAQFVFTDALIIIDNLKASARIVVGVPLGDMPRTDVAGLRNRFELAQQTIDRMESRLRGPSPLAALSIDEAAWPATGTCAYTRERFELDVQRIKQYIAAGDCFQALLARRIAVPHDFDSTSLYRALRALNPSPYMYHLALDGTELVGSSPELLVRVADGRVVLRPIAGTRPRGGTDEEDATRSAELSADAKECAEHVMLVDLGRNDVGRIAKYGTVRVTDLMVVERFSHVLHLVSQIQGELRDGLSCLDVLRATFPAGTMTGAPKVRAMEIIDELEPERRGPYAGGVGYIAAGDDRMDVAITIRTCVIAGGTASVQAGAGIVADSVPSTEWEETESKARALLTALGRVRAAR
ncbi:MAG: Anthranilate synthase component 1 [Gemmatimonadaceae bacterium]|nr:Anthranilate synthase component 1 [Gemmatimonadaceae bacterium]